MWGAPGEILKRSLRIYRQKLWHDIKGVNRSARDHVMTDFDLGAQHLEYLEGAKHACWAVLPLHLMGTAHYDDTKARAAASNCIRQLEGLPEHIHDPYIAELLVGDSVDTTFKTELVEFSRGAQRDDLAVFDAQACEFELMRVNELSIERLHAIGSQEVARGKNLSAASQSFALRRKQIFGLDMNTDTDFVMLSDACQALGGVDGMIKKFNFEHHPGIKEFLTRSAARGHIRKLFNVPHKLIRQIFYHCDSYSLYHVQGELQAAINDQRSRDATERSVRAEDPLSHARAPAASEEVKVMALHHKLAFEHFKDIDKQTVNNN